MFNNKETLLCKNRKLKKKQNAFFTVICMRDMGGGMSVCGGGVKRIRLLMAEEFGIQNITLQFKTTKGYNALK